jgi:hypothetical protein
MKPSDALSVVEHHTHVPRDDAERARLFTALKSLHRMATTDSSSAIAMAEAESIAEIR